MLGYYDTHCHILPEVDDGAIDIGMAQEMLRQEYADGVSVVFVTPHYRVGMFEPSREKVFQQFELLKEYARQSFPGLELHLGCEFHANMDMVMTLTKETGYSMGTSRCVLIEFSHIHDFSYIRERCYSLLRHGYLPIIAHAERYPVLNCNIERLNSLRNMGVFIQINARSILGKNGFFLKRFCRKLMNHDLIDIIGSDAHDLSDRKPLIGPCARYIQRKMGNDYMEKIFIHNPTELLQEGRKG